MKFLELTGYGNKIKHFIALKSISDITFESTHTNISFISGKALNVVESKEEIEKMIYYLEGIIINKDTADYEMHNDFWDVTPYDDQDLPF
jgi:hypothetical protein